MSAPGSSDLSLETLLKETVMRGGSDLHLIHGHPPILRICNEVQANSSTPLDSSQIWAMAAAFLNEHHQRNFQIENRVNVSFTISTLGRFRMNLCKAQGTISASLRVIP
ncbi:MAG: hypothetical protein AAB578_03925, partial [Elusimicrobiota bacterium]